MIVNKAMTLIELIIVMVIASILAGVGFSGYMGIAREHRRQDAVIALQENYMEVQKGITKGNVLPDSITIIPSMQGLYTIEYSKTGYSASLGNSFLTASEKLILRATAVKGQGQDKDKSSCQTIYLSDEYKLYPLDCVS